jgi:hypothetical protein
MKLAVATLFTVASVASGAKLCLPLTHSTFVQGFSDRETTEGHHDRPQEYKQGGQFQIFSQAGIPGLQEGMSLV